MEKWIDIKKLQQNINGRVSVASIQVFTIKSGTALDIGKMTEQNFRELKAGQGRCEEAAERKRHGTARPTFGYLGPPGAGRQRDSCQPAPFPRGLT